jgi:hypothetical protein
VPTNNDNNFDGGHGAKSAFAHPTGSIVIPGMTVTSRP